MKLEQSAFFRQYKQIWCLPVWKFRVPGAVFNNHLSFFSYKLTQFKIYNLGKNFSSIVIQYPTKKLLSEEVYWIRPKVQNKKLRWK